MARTIWKFTLNSNMDQPVQMPGNSKILTAQMQDGKICLWATVTPGVPIGQRLIKIYGTGWDMDTTIHPYIATVQDGALVWHIFDGDFEGRRENGVNGTGGYEAAAGG